MFVGYALDQSSRTYKFYNPTTDDIAMSNSVQWSLFKPWEVANLEEATGNLNTTTLGKIEEILKPSYDIDI